MKSGLLDSLFCDPFSSPRRIVYVVADSQLEALDCIQREEELDNLETSRKQIEESYQSRIKTFDEGEHQLQAELKVLALANQETVMAYCIR